MAGDLPPNSRVTEARWAAAALITILPTRGLPVKKIWSNGRDSSPVATSSPPCNTVTSPSNTSSTISAMSWEVCGVNSEGFSTATLPAARHDTSGPTDRLKGKFQGERTRHTPLGS